MKVLSHGLIKGYIDRVEKQLIVNWIQPKFLDKEIIVLIKIDLPPGLIRIIEF